MQLTIADIDLFLLVFMRMSGMVLFNPLLGRRNVPTLLKGALSLILAFLVTPTLDASASQTGGLVQLSVCCAVELLIGFMLGVILSGLFSVVLLAGEMIDLQMGFSMANFYDPKSNISMPVVGSYFNVLLVVGFFSANAHLTLFRLLADSCRVFPPGRVVPSAQALQFVVKMGGDLFELGLRMALPLLAVEIIVQLALGILMRAVPQLNVFTVGIQVETLAGMIMLLVLVPAIMSLNGRLIDYMLEKSVELMRLMKPA